jgi:hypothetical protein
VGGLSPALNLSISNPETHPFGKMSKSRGYGCIVRSCFCHTNRTSEKSIQESPGTDKLTDMEPKAFI